jgi:anti-anti-sigma factor
MNGLNITIEDLNPPIAGKIVKIAAFKGMLDSTNVEESKLLFDEVIAKNPTSLFLIFDFSGLDYLNSRAIGCLVECYEALLKGGGGIFLANPVPNVKDVISVVGIDKFLTMFPTVLDAITALQGSSAAATLQPAAPAAIDEPPPRIILE